MNLINQTDDVFKLSKPQSASPRLKKKKRSSPRVAYNKNPDDKPLLRQVVVYTNQSIHDD